jgi:outer membrane immunogenic protein
MKSLIVAASAVAIAASVPAMAQAQTAPTTGAYINLGAAHADAGQPNYEVLQGKLGYRFNTYLGVEGELATGLKGHDDTLAGVNVHSKLEHEAAIYGVGFLPVSPNTDLIARVGYGTTKIKAKAAGISDSDSAESWNFGVGAQHYFDGVNGVRVDYTRQEFNHDQGHANVFGVAYTRRF